MNVGSPEQTTPTILRQLSLVIHALGSIGDSYDNAFAETIDDLYKAEVIHRRRPWQSFETLEFPNFSKESETSRQQRPRNSIITSSAQTQNAIGAARPRWRAIYDRIGCGGGI